MEDQSVQKKGCIKWRILVLLSTLLLLVYSNTFNASWHFDDFHNITRNAQLQIDNLYPETLYDVIIKNKSENRVLYRPVSNFSLALNWYFNKADVTGYHAVNIFIHIFTAFFLYLTVLTFFKTPNLKEAYRGSEHFIAILATILWAAHPIQTQAVTYIVQRMASMAGLFYILGIYFYMNARINCLQLKRLYLYFGAFIAFLLAVGSKENALMFPVSLFFVELIFFRNMGDPKTRKRFVWFGCILAAVLFVTGIALFMNNGFISQLQDGYAGRTFSLKERILTQPRIIIFYVSQIFYPIADRLSIAHDFELSKGLFRPWTTLPAIMLILCTISMAFWKIKKYPLGSFAVLFFFLNHVIESSIIPLELVFEHRNYIPSLFIFVPIAAAFKWGIDYYYALRKTTMAMIISIFAVILVISLGLGTFVRNTVWATEKTLWEDALKKAPGTARPYQNLAVDYYAKIKDWDKVEELCEQAMNLFSNTSNKAERLSLVNIAAAYAKRDENYKKVTKLYEKALLLDPDNSRNRYRLAVALIRAGESDKAMKHLSQLISNHPENSKYLTTKALILIQKNKPEIAFKYLSRAIKKTPDDPTTTISLGKAKSMLGKHEAAEHFFNRIRERSSHKAGTLLLQIENSVKADNVKDAEKYAEKLILKTNPEIIRKMLKKANEPGLVWPVSTELIAPVIADVLKEKSMKIADLPNTDEKKAKN